jgi:hypothetical protein
VGGVQRGLHLAQSTIDGSLDPDASLGYLEWVMEFANESGVAQEARAQIQLPEGGVVSRATLWVHGVEREAVIASRTAARQAYESVVRRSRDPLLITTAGGERVLVQCFPVPPAGRMKIRVGVTFPLVLRDRTNSFARLPYFVERNFAVRSGLRHAVWIESEGRLQAPDAALPVGIRNDRSDLRGLLTDDALKSSGLAGREIALTHEPVASAWATDIEPPPLAPKKGPAPSAPPRYVVQRIEERPAFRPGRIAIVLDASATMKGAGPKLASALAAVPAGTEIFIVPASDQNPRPLNPEPYVGGTAIPDALREALLGQAFEGGIDNSGALGVAWDLASSGPNGVVLWVHGPQPILVAQDQALNQRFERRPNGARLWLYPAFPGPNRIVEGLSPRASTRWLAASRDLESGLRDLFTSIGASATDLVRVRDRVVADSSSNPGPVTKTSGHLARLWANDMITAGLRETGRTDEIVSLAVRYRLVTSVSGAVVLETAADYKEAGLDVKPPQDIPTVPEPEVWALMAIALSMIAWRARESRRTEESRA